MAAGKCETTRPIVGPIARRHLGRWGIGPEPQVAGPAYPPVLAAGTAVENTIAITALHRAGRTLSPRGRSRIVTRARPRICVQVAQKELDPV